MPTPVTMPRLGLSMVEGTVTEWRVKPGDRVQKGEVVLLVESEKAEVEVEAFESGTLAAVYVEPGRTVPIGELLGVIVSPGEDFDRDAYAAAYVPERAGAPATSGEAVSPPAPAAPTARSDAPAGPRIAPAARALAKRLGIDPAAITGSGPGGRVLPEDVERAAAALVDVGGARIAATATGEGPALLFINGFAVDSSGWRRQVDPLGTDHRVITFELRGIGDSPRGGDAASLDLFAADAEALLRHFGAERAVVVGASLGAAVALELARRAPAALGGLVLLSPVFGEDVRLDAVLASWAALEEPAARAATMLPWILGRDLLADEVRREAVLAGLRAMAGRAPARALGEHREALRNWLGEAEPPIAPGVPVRILVGEDDLLAPPAVADALARRLGATAERLAGAGHALMIERAELVNERIRDLARAAAGR